MNNEKFLPIGTVVLLKGGKRELMIMGYCINPTGDVYDKNGKVDAAGKIFDYGACLYPEGMIKSDQVFAFNHEQIERISFMGYVTDTQKELSRIIRESIEEVQSNNNTHSVLNNVVNQNNYNNQVLPQNNQNQGE